MHILHWLNQKAKNLFVKLEGAVSGCFLFLFGIDMNLQIMFGLMVVMALDTFICCLYQLLKSYSLATFLALVVLVCLVPTSTFARAWLHL